MKKVLALTLAFIMVLGLNSFVFAEDEEATIEVVAESATSEADGVIELTEESEIELLDVAPLSGKTGSDFTNNPTIAQKLTELFNLLPYSSYPYFTTYGNKTCSNSKCDYCEAGEVVDNHPNLKNLGLDSSKVSGWSCFGFAQFAYYYIFGRQAGEYGTETQKDISTLKTVARIESFDAATCKSTLAKAKAGDIIQGYGSNGTHTVIFLGCSDTYAYVLQNNYFTETYGKNRVSVSGINYTTFANSYNTRMTIYRCPDAYYPDMSSSSYTVTFDKKGGTGGPDASYTVTGSTFTIPSAIPTRFPYTFLGYTTSGLDVYLPGQTISISGNMTLTTSWICESVTLTSSSRKDLTTTVLIPSTKYYYELIVSNTGTYGFESYADGQDTVIYLYDENGNFLANNDDGGDGQNFKLTYPLSAGQVYYCKIGFHNVDQSGSFQVSMSSQYTISYNANGGSGAPSSQTKSHGASTILSSVEPTRSGYRFLGWATSSSGSVAYSPGDTYSSNSSVTLYAKWESTRTQIASGTTGEADNISWVLYADGEFVLSGSGETLSHSNMYNPWYEYRDQIIKGTVGDNITDINKTFNGCSNLVYLSLGDSVSVFHSNLVSGCNNLKSIIVSEDNDYYSSDDKGVLFSKDKTQLIFCPPTINATSYEIPESVTSIGHSAFKNCTNLTRVGIPKSVTSIGEYAFSNTNLTSITIPNSITSIEDYTFLRSNNLTTVTIPNSVRSIGIYAFASCKSLTSISIPNSVTSIGMDAFEYCTSLTSIVIPDSITRINEYTFSGCENLASVTIPSSITSIDSYAFRGCKFEHIYVNDIVAFWNISFSLGAERESFNGKLHILENGVPITEFYVPGSVTEIPYYAFYNCVDLTTIHIPDSVTSIGDYAFYKCTNLTSISIPDSVTSVGPSALMSCTSLTSVSLPNSIESIGSHTFNNCTSLTSISIPDSVTSIGYYAFQNCTSLTSITIPDNVTSIGNWAFRNCTSLTSITIPDSVTSIGYYAFQNCTSLTSITIPDGVTSIGDSAFNRCTSLTSITIPDSVTSISDSAFSGCSNITIICNANSEAHNYAVSNNINYRLNSITVTLAPNGGTITPTTIEVAHESPYGDLPTPTKDGYNFLGWFTAETGGTEVTSETVVTETTDHTLYAQWENKVTSVTGVSLNSTTLSLTEGSSAILTATVSPSDATNKTVTWQSSNTSVATVSDGVVTAVSAGNATITATTHDGGFTATCTVTVNAAAVDPDAPTIEVTTTKTAPGKTVQVAITIPENPGVALVGFDVQYDNTNLTLDSITAGDIFSETEMDGNVEKTPFTFTAYTGKDNKTASGTLVILNFTVSENAPEGDYAITLSDVEALDIEENDVTLAPVAGKITVSNVTPGDVTGDGTFSRADLLRIAKHFSGWEVEIDSAGADATGDGAVTRADLLRIAKHFSGWEVTIGS